MRTSIAALGTLLCVAAMLGLLALGLDPSLSPWLFWVGIALLQLLLTVNRLRHWARGEGFWNPYDKAPYKYFLP